MNNTDLSAAVERYERALTAGDDRLIRAAFDQVADDDIDAFLERLDALGLDVPQVDVDGAAVSDALRSAGVSQDASSLAASITCGSFDDFVRVRAGQLQIGADTLVDRVEGSGLLEDDTDVALAYRYISSVLSDDDDGEAGVDLEPSVVLALAQVLDTPGTLLDAVARRAD